MVPLINFVKNKETLHSKDKVKETIESLFLPGKYSSIERRNYSPFIRILEFMENEDAFFSNPSMEAIMNWMWYCSKNYCHNTLYIYIIYLLSYSIISWAYIAHLEVTGYLHIPMILIIILFYYLAYYHVIIEVNQFIFYGKNYVKNAFNWVDTIAIFLSVLLSFYFLFGYYRIDYGFKNATTTPISVFTVIMSIVFLWCDLFLLLRIWPRFNNYLTTIVNIAISIRALLIFYILLIIAVGHVLFLLLGHPSYLSLSQDPDTYDVMHTNSNKIVYTMVGEEPKNPFANLLNSILAVYNWGSIPLDTWNFWPLVVINVIGGFFFVMILSNVIISFMGNAFEDAEKESKYSTLFLQKELICDYAFQDRSSLTSKINDFDHKFKDKLNIRYICFLDEPELTKSWDDKSNELGYRWLNAYGLHFKHEKSDEDNIEEVRFIWTREEHMG